MIVIVDYGAANLLSITRALEAVGASVTVSGSPADIVAAEAVVLPGVGAAGAAMARLRASGADAALRDVVTAGRPLLGLCLGMQLFFERLAEDDTEGLGLLRGEAVLMSSGQKIPHMGWNTLTWAPDAPGAELFAGLAPGATYAYFVHSYVCVPADPVAALAYTDYGQPICAAVYGGLAGQCLAVETAPGGPAGREVRLRGLEREQAGAIGSESQRISAALYGLQFHPEKSGAAGLRMLTNWLALVARGQAPGRITSNFREIEVHTWQP